MKIYKPNSQAKVARGDAVCVGSLWAHHLDVLVQTAMALQEGVHLLLVVALLGEEEVMFVIMPVMLAFVKQSNLQEDSSKMPYHPAKGFMTCM